MKKKALVIALLVICLSLIGFGTAAYFTHEDTATNVITSGNIQIELKEWADAAKETPFEDVTGVMPGAKVTKIVEVTNTGDNPAWVRVKADKDIQLAQGVEGTPNTSLVKLDIDTTKWTEKNGWYYYNEQLAPDATTAPLFTTVTFDTAMGNMYQNSTATVAVTAQAVQTANNGTTVAEAAGWPNAE